MQSENVRDLAKLHNVYHGTHVAALDLVAAARQQPRVSGRVGRLDCKVEWPYFCLFCNICQQTIFLRSSSRRDTPDATYCCRKTDQQEEDEEKDAGMHAFLVFY